jgi:hypothetical protein
MSEPKPDFISSDCQLAGHHIEQGIGLQNAGTPVDDGPQLAHPITLVRMAYGID